MPAELLETPEMVLALLGPYCGLLVLLFLQNANGALQTLGRVRIRLRVLAKDVGIAPQPSPSGDNIIGRQLGRGELLQLGGKRFQPCRRGLRKQAAALLVLERPARVLEAPREGRGILRRHRREVVPLDLELGNPVCPIRSCEALDLLANRDAIRLLSGDRPGALFLGRSFLLTLGDRLAYRV
jgi:hypothetical protein